MGLKFLWPLPLLLFFFFFAGTSMADSCSLTQADYDPGQSGSLMEVWWTAIGWDSPWEPAPTLDYPENFNTGTENYGWYDCPNIIVNTGDVDIPYIPSTTLVFRAHTINITPGAGTPGAVSVQIPDWGTYLVSASFLMIDVCANSVPQAEARIYLGTEIMLVVYHFRVWAKTSE